MKLLKEEEYDQLALKGRGRSSHIFNSIVNLHVGEAVLIEKKDWNRKASPSTLVKYIEKHHQLKFTCGALLNGQGWAVKRLETDASGIHKNNQTSDYKKIAINSSFTGAKNIVSAESELKLKSEITIFYLGRIAAMKIEKTEESLKAVMDMFWEEDRALLKKLFMEVINVLYDANHIVIENEKTYIPLKRN